MGTAAVFAVASPNEGKHYRKIIGMTSDGFPGNLDYLAALFCETAREMRLLTKVKKNDHEAVMTVMQAICAADQWLFMDDVRNAEWVSYSVILDPKRGQVKHYEGNLEYLQKVKSINPSRARTQSGEGKNVAELAKKMYRFYEPKKDKAVLL